MSAPSLSSPASERFRKYRNWALIIVTYLISVVCMYYVFSGAHFHLIWGEVRRMSWGWVAFAVGSDVLVYLMQSWRWMLILKPVENISFWTSVRAIYVGLFANEVLPLRAGELIRCFLMTRWSSIPLSVSFASALIERIFDGVWLMACFFVTLRLAKLPPVLQRGGYVLGVLVVVAALVIGLGMFAKRQSVNHLFGFSFPKWFDTLVEDLHLIGHSRYLYFAFLASGGFMFAQLLPIYGVIRAYGLDIHSDWATTFAMMVLLRLSSVVPQAPGNIGLFQGVAFETLRMFRVNTAVAKRFSFILWAIVTIPLIIIGFAVLTISGASMTSIHRDAKSAAEERRVSK